MDSFIIDRLEWMMMCSPVSPFAVARFLLVGSGLSFSISLFFVLLNSTSSPDVIFHSFVGIWLIAILIGASRQTEEAERANACGRINPLKKNRVERLSVLWVLVFIGPLMLIPPVRWSDILWTFAVLLYSATIYFQALNWTPPRAKQLIPSGAGA